LCKQSNNNRTNVGTKISSNGQVPKIAPNPIESKKVNSLRLGNSSVKHSSPVKKNSLLRHNVKIKNVVFSSSDEEDDDDFDAEQPVSNNNSSEISMRKQHKSMETNDQTTSSKRKKAIPLSTRDDGFLVEQFLIVCSSNKHFINNKSSHDAVSALSVLKNMRSMLPENSTTVDATFENCCRSLGLPNGAIVVAMGNKLLNQSEKHKCTIDPVTMHILTKLSIQFYHNFVALRYKDSGDDNNRDDGDANKKQKIK
jgi:hypothetical protein